MSASSADLERQCAEFNANYPIGSGVVVRKDKGDGILTETTSAAYVLSGHSAVIHLAGISGCYLLSRVTPLLGAHGS